jgi:hypothetical protein
MASIKDTISFLVFEAPAHHSVMLRGDHGIGKSEIAKQASEILRKVVLKVESTCFGFLDRRLSEDDVGDLKGVPAMIGGHTYYFPPAWLPLHPEDELKIKGLMEEAGRSYVSPEHPEHGVLFLDELNRAAQDVQNACMKLTLDHAIGDWRIHPGWRIWSAINSDTGLYSGVQEMDAAAKSRFRMIDFTPTVPEWMSYAKEKDVKVLGKVRGQRVHSAITRFLEKLPTHLDHSKEEIRMSVANDKQVQDRRAWVALSEMLYHIDDQVKEGLPVVDPLKSSGALMRLAVSCIGVTVGVPFVDFVEKEYDILTADTILDVGLTAKVQKQIEEAAVSELTDLHETLGARIEEDYEGKLTKTQTDNLRDYFLFAPKIVMAHLWDVAVRRFKGIGREVYKNEEIKTKVLAVLKGYQVDSE